MKLSWEAGLGLEMTDGVVLALANKAAQSQQWPAAGLTFKPSTSRMARGSPSSLGTLSNLTCPEQGSLRST